MLNKAATFLGISRDNSFASNMLVPAFLVACAAGFYYLTIGSKNQAYRYVSQAVSPYMNPNADLSNLETIDHGHAVFAAYRISDTAHLYTELDTPYSRSKLLSVIGLPALGPIRYGTLKDYRPESNGRAMLFDTRMLATAKDSPEQCAQHLAAFGPWLHTTLNNKPWPLEFALRTSSATPPITSIESSTLAGYSPPRMFALCVNSIFIFVTTHDH